MTPLGLRISDALRDATLRLRAVGCADPAADARRLMAHALGVAPGRVTLLAQEALDPDAEARFDSAVTAREARQPVAQIVGRRSFWGRDFLVTPEVLDPRPETETLVGAALAEPFVRVLDLGTGTGCLLLSLLAERPDATGLGIDISEEALAVARRNATALGLAGRATFRRGNWTEGVTGRFDLIVSNPPYIAEGELAGLAPEVRHWEPVIALSPGGDGLGAYRAILAGIPGLLAPRGRVMVEIGPTQAPEVGALMSGAGLAPAQLLHDLDGRPRVLVARLA